MAAHDALEDRMLNMMTAATSQSKGPRFEKS